MNKGSQIRAKLRQHEAVFTNDVAREVGCTQPRVFQVISEMRDEGSLFEERQVGRRRTYRLLPEDEAWTRRAAQKELEVEHRRRQEIAKARDVVVAARAMLDDALQRLESLVP